MLLFRATYVVRLQFDSVPKDVSCEVGFLKDFVECSIILKSTQQQGKYKNRFTGSRPKVRPNGNIVKAIFILYVNKLAKGEQCVVAYPSVYVSLTVSLSCPSVSAL